MAVLAISRSQWHLIVYCCVTDAILTRFCMSFLWYTSLHNSMVSEAAFTISHFRAAAAAILRYFCCSIALYTAICHSMSHDQIAIGIWIFSIIHVVKFACRQCWTSLNYFFRWHSPVIGMHSTRGSRLLSRSFFACILRTFTTCKTVPGARSVWTWLKSVVCGVACKLRD